MRNLHLNFLLDKRNIRFLKILSLFEGQPEYLLRDLAEDTGFNERTLLVDIKNLRHYLKDYAEIKTTRSGYHFKVLNPNSYAQNKRELVAHEPLFVIIESILVGKLLSFEEWADYFFLSESSMRRHLLRLSDVLKIYDLHFLLNPVDLVGDEVNIRKFLKDFYYEADEISPFTLEPSVEMDELIHSIQENRYYASAGTDILPTDFYFQFYIMIQRSAQKKYIKIPKIENMNWQEDKNYHYFLSLKPKIYSRYGFEIPDHELLALYLFSICKRSIEYPKKEALFCQQFNKWPNVKQLAEKFCLFYDPILNNPIFSTTLLIESFFTSVKYLDQYSPIMNKNIFEVNEYAESSYPGGFAKSLSFLKKHIKEFDIDSSYIKDIAANLTLTIEAIRDVYVQNPKRIAFLLEGSSFVCRSVKAKATRYLLGYHELFFPNIEQIDERYFVKNKIDIFITNYADYIIYLEEDIDYVLFNSIPDMKDWNHLLQRINPQITKDFWLVNRKQIDSV